MTPEDKLRLARAMQEQGLIVAMTGDAVNDAAALKQADIGVAMGSGSEVTKQAARMVLTDDNFGTLVHAVEIGRRVYDKVVSYVRYQMTQLLSLVFLFLVATIFDINQGVAMTPTMVLFLLFFATASGVVIIAVDPGDPDVMHRPPRDASVPITNRAAVVDVGRLRRRPVRRRRRAARVAGPTSRASTRASASMTMTFVVMGLGTTFNALVNRRDPTSGLTPPIAKALAIGLVPVGMLFLATQLPSLQAGLLTVPLTAGAVARVRRAGRAPADRRRGRKAAAAQADPRTGPAEPPGRRRAGAGPGRPAGRAASGRACRRLSPPTPDGRSPRAGEPVGPRSEETDPGRFGQHRGKERIMARSGGRTGLIGLIVIIVGIIFAVAGVVTWFVVGNELAAENITVSEDADYLAGQDVTGPLDGLLRGQTIQKHALEATGGKTYAELDREDPARQTAMQASFLRASLFTSVVAFGVAALATVLGIMLVLIGMALRSLSATAEPPGTSTAGA